jgi:hypothetical protein
MSEPPTNEENLQVLPSVDDVKPEEEGGPIARSGFNYQDEIAVSFLIEMLENPALLKVHCETHDDVLLVYEVDGSATHFAEFVQVKASEQDKLWSVADLCARKSRAVGSSIFEISLARDKHAEISRFRLVTLRPVVSDLKALTFQFGAPGRESDGEWFKRLEGEIAERFPNVKSRKGNGVDYWLKNCLWDIRHSKEAVCKDNLVRLVKLGLKERIPLLLEPAEILLEELRSKARAAGDAKWEPDRQKKIFTRAALSQWWNMRAHQLIEGAEAPSGGKLRKKMTEAGLPREIIELAVELRRDYAAVARAPYYMEPERRERLQRRVKADVMSMQARLAAGRLVLNGPGFHALCVDQMDKINDELPSGTEDQSAFIKGCMYDIADRCLLRFERLVQ